MLRRSVLTVAVSLFGLHRNQPLRRCFGRFRLWCALEGKFIITEERSASEITRDTSWKTMLGKDEREASEEEIAALEADHGPFQPADGEG
jgi:hypothetical protein